MAKSEVILFEDFEDSSNLILAGCVPAYWDIAPLHGSVSIPSSFLQGSSSQSGNIFYGSFAKENAGSPAATMTIILPDLSGYTNLKLTVTLASAGGLRWEPTHRDSLRIIGSTTIYPPYVDCSMSAGCQSVTGEIDIFLPILYPDYLWNIVHSTFLGPEFQDFMYTIDSSLKSLTFAFASTDYVEVIGIDSVKITGDHVIITELINIDIKPGSYTNCMNINGHGIIPVAILGGEDFDVNNINIESLLLNGSAVQVRGNKEKTMCHFEDVSGNFTSPEGAPDGLTDLVCQFEDDPLQWVEGQAEAKVTGKLLDGTLIEGTDSICIVP